MGDIIRYYFSAEGGKEEAVHQFDKMCAVLESLFVTLYREPWQDNGASAAVLSGVLVAFGELLLDAEESLKKGKEPADIFQAVFCSKGKWESLIMATMHLQGGATTEDEFERIVSEWRTQT